jgi:NAD(P)-dependent dehydrogenase (short-subunit alcohol dehydrogenase family)
MACRDVNRSENALKEVKDRSNNSLVYLLKLDLTSMDSIREFAKNFQEIESRLHILVCNAGIMAVEKGKTKDGFEMQIGVNHLGHFLLTNLLLDLLKMSSPSRIVVVSSSLHKTGKINKEDLMSEKSYGRWSAYGQSKLANVLFAKELAKKLDGTGVTVNSLHPGKFIDLLNLWTLSLKFP